MKYNTRKGDLSVQEACSVLCVTAPTIYRLINKGDLTSYKAGRARRIKAESIEALRNK